MSSLQTLVDLEELKNKFNQRAQIKLQEMRVLLLHYAQNYNADDIILQLHSICLALANTSKSLGLDLHCQLAEDISNLASRLLIRSELPEPIVDDMSALLNQLMRLSLGEITPLTINNPPDSDEKNLPSLDFPISQPISVKPMIAIQMGESKNSAEIITALELAGYQTTLVTTLDKLIGQLPELAPAAVLIDLNHLTDPLQKTHKIALDALQKNHCPIIYLSEDDHFGARLKAVRLQGSAFFAKPLDLFALSKRLNQLLLKNHNSACRILVIQPKAELAKKIAVYCQEICHCDILAITAYHEALTRAIEFQPHLAIIDMDQNDILGTHVAAILHQYDSFMHLHCLLLTSESHPVHQDYPSIIYQKTPAAGQELNCENLFKQSLQQHLQRTVPRLNHLAEQIFFDPLTGTLLANKFHTQLDAMLSSAKRYGTVLNCALIDIDSLQQINQQYGFWVGDRVITCLANILTRRLRRSDLIARVGGNRFAVIMPNTSLNNAHKVIENLKENFALLPQTTLGKTFYSSFSAGLSSFPQHDSMTQLLENVQQHLQSAKTQGRNRLSRD